MKLDTRLAALTVFAMLVTSSTPVVADMCLKPQLLDSGRGQTFDARSLVTFLKENGVLEINLEWSTSIDIAPALTLIDSREGKLGNVAGNAIRATAGRHALTDVTNGIFSKLIRELDRLPGLKKYSIDSVATLEHDEDVRFQNAENVRAVIVLEFDPVNPPRGERINSHKLAIFLRTPH